MARVKWRSKITVPDPSPKLRSIVSKQHETHEDLAVMWDKCQEEKEFSDELRAHQKAI